MKVHELLADPTKWAQGSYAYGPAGKHVPVEWNEATCFCAVGAIRRCYDSPQERLDMRDAVERHLEETCVGSNLVIWNDHPTRTHAEVLNLFKELDI